MLPQDGVGIQASLRPEKCFFKNSAPTFKAPVPEIV
jgi:hypothetical protein